MIDLVSRIEGDLKTKQPSQIRSQLVKEGYKEKEIDEAFTKFYSKKSSKEDSLNISVNDLSINAAQEIPLKGHETFGPGDAAITVMVIGLLIVGYIYGAPLLKEKGLWPEFSKTTETQTETPSIDTSPTELQAVQVPADTDESLVKEFSITAKKFEFIPNEIRVKKGDRVRIKAKSIDVPHGLAIPAFSVEMGLPLNEEKTIEFTATKAGTFDFYCAVFCGSGHGDMRGLLFVEP